MEQIVLPLLCGLCAAHTVFVVDFDAIRSADTGTSPLSVTSGDFNGDTYPDLALADTGSGTVSVLMNVVDRIPDEFSFSGQTNAPLDTQLTSNTVTLAGLDGSTAITVSGGQYSINGGAYTAAAGTGGNSDTVTVRQTSSASYADDQHRADHRRSGPYLQCHDACKCRQRWQRVYGWRCWG